MTYLPQLSSEANNLFLNRCTLLFEVQRLPIHNVQIYTNFCLQEKGNLTTNSKYIYYRPTQNNIWEFLMQQLTNNVVTL